MARWLAGDLTEAELQEVQQLPEFPEWQRIAGLSKELAPPKFDAAASWERFTELREVPTETPETTSEPKPGGKTIDFRKFRVPAALLLIAASVALLLVLFLRGGAAHFSTAPGETLAVNLPDGSQVTLAGASALTYDEKNWETDRTVELEGDAYFKVEKGSTFKVNSKWGQVEVLGTQFQVRNLASGYRVWCVTGKVGVSFANQNERVELLPNQAVKWNGKDAPEPFEFTPTDFKNGVQHVFRYENADFQTVVADLERQFNIQVKMPDMSGRTYNGAFFHDDLERSLKLVTDPMGLTYAQSEDGTVTFEKVKE